MGPAGMPATTTDTENDMTRTTRTKTGRTTFHRNGSVTLWDCRRQEWVTGSNPSDALLATLDQKERARVLQHTA